MYYVFFLYQSLGQGSATLDQFKELKSNLESSEVIANRPVVIIDNIRSSNRESDHLAEYLTSALEITLSELDYFNVEDPNNRVPSSPDEINEPRTFTIGISGFLSKEEDNFQIYL